MVKMVGGSLKRSTLARGGVRLTSVRRDDSRLVGLSGGCQETARLPGGPPVTRFLVEATCFCHSELIFSPRAVMAIDLESRFSSLDFMAVKLSMKLTMETTASRFSAM